MKIPLRLLLGSLLVLAGSGLAAQERAPDAAGETPTVDAAEETLGEAALTTDEADEAEEAGSAEPDPAEGTGDEAAEGVAEGAEAEIKATMERFVPSEQISEDRSVSFPNDI